MNAYYVVCPHCSDKIDIPDDAVGVDRTDLWNVAECEGCLLAFDYDDSEVHNDCECKGHPAGEFDRMGETVYCDGSCRKG